MTDDVMEYTFCANIVKKDPGGTSQISLATAGTTSPNLEHGIKEISVEIELLYTKQMC